MNRLINLVRNGFCASFLCMLGVGFSVQAQAGQFTAAEIANLPQYCQDKLNGDRNKERWVSTFGQDNWLHLHHYCFGLIYFSRASMDFDENSKRHNINNATGDFNYVLQRWPTNMPLYRMAQMYKQQLEMMRDWN